MYSEKNNPHLILSIRLCEYSTHTQTQTQERPVWKVTVINCKNDHGSVIAGLYLFIYLLRKMMVLRQYDREKIQNQALTIWESQTHKFKLSMT